MLDQFFQRNQLHYPSVLKHDYSEGGKGVAIGHSQQAAEDYLAFANINTLVQAYAPGREYGIFYASHPDEAQGAILSLTDKRPT